MPSRPSLRWFPFYNGRHPVGGIRHTVRTTRIMNSPQLGDIARQFAVVFAAIFQVYGSYSVGRSVGVIAQENRSLILPASYAFSIWGPIFILCGLYALYQALPAQRENSTFRAIGLWTA